MGFSVESFTDISGFRLWVNSLNSNLILQQENTNIEHMLQQAFASRVSDLQTAEGLAQKALQASTAIMDKALMAKSLNHLSLFHMIKGDYEMSLNQANEAIKYFESLDDELGIADAKYNIAGLYYKTDNFHLGLVYLLDCLSIYNKYKNYQNIARTLKSMGTIYDYLGDTNNSRKVYEEAVKAAEQINDPNLISNAYNPLSSLYLKQNDPGMAMKLISKAIELKEQSGDIRGLAFSIYGRGKVYAFLKEYDKAIADYLNALEIHEKMGEKLGKAMTLFKLGVVYLALNNYSKSKELLNITLDFCRLHNITYIRIKACNEMYRICKFEGNHNLALTYLEEFTSLREDIVKGQTSMVIRNYEMITRMQNQHIEAEMEREKAIMKQKQLAAEETARTKQDFLSTMSHEIRTPLNAIISITSMLNENHFDDEEKKLFQYLKHASSNLLMLINDILDFTKLDHGKLSLELRATDLSHTAIILVNTYHAMAVEKGLSLNTIIDHRLSGAYNIDETKLQQILGNLISNAIKYSEKGSVELKMELVGRKGDKDEIKFSVSDTGVGISSEQQDLIFDSFYRPDSVTTRSQSGSGLGLAIVKKLITLFGSNIQLKSEPGIGSTFYFTVTMRKVDAYIPIPLNYADSLQDKRALIAEDNMVNAIVSKKLLAKWGTLSDHAKSGKEAVVCALAKKYDFILMDIHMPEMNGIEAAAEIRNTDNPNKDTPIYALTADINTENNSLGLFNQVLRKPIEIDKLYEALSGKSARGNS